MNIRRWAEQVLIMGLALLIFLTIKILFTIAVIGVWSICCA